LGEGSRFRVFLPLVEIAASTTSATHEIKS